MFSTQLIILTEITGEKEYEQELEATKERLGQTNEELETLNRILRHDIRNDAVAQSQLGKRLREHVDEKGEEYLDQLLGRGEHIADITTGMRSLMHTTLGDEQDLTSLRLDTVLEAEIERVTTAYKDVTVRLAKRHPAGISPSRSNALVGVPESTRERHPA